MKLYVKYMFSLPCKDRVKEELLKLKIPYVLVEIGVVELPADLCIKQREMLKNSLLLIGFVLHTPKKGVLFEKIKTAVFEMIKFSDGQPVVSYSVYLSESLDYHYTYLANIFSEVSGISIKQYIILCKIEIVKELILEDELNLTKISHKLNYSSVSHLSAQFKKVTGLSPSDYKALSNLPHP